MRRLSTSGVLAASILARLSLRRRDFNDQLGLRSTSRVQAAGLESPHTTIQLVHTGSSVRRIAYLRGVAYSCARWSAGRPGMTLRLDVQAQTIAALPRSETQNRLPRTTLCRYFDI